MNKAASRKLEVSMCLKYWTPLKALVTERIAANQAEIQAMTAAYVEPTDLPALNRKISAMNGLEQILLLENELKEELHPEEAETVEA